MKIIEAMKDIKRIEEKVHDLVQKIGKYCADLDFENPVYPDQKAKVSEWLQSVHDSLKESTDLKIAIQKTNLGTPVTIELGGKSVTKSIAEWIVRRRTYADLEMKSYLALTDKNLKDGQGKNSVQEIVTFKVRRYFDPVVRDAKVEEYRSEPSIIDRTLEVINATTEVLV